MKTNKRALRQMEKTEFLATSARTQKPTVNDRLDKLGPELFGEGSGETPSVPDWNQLQEWGIAALETSAEEVRRTDVKHRKSRVRLANARQDRNGKVKRISADHRALRKSFAGTYGVSSLPLVGLEAEPARALMAIREQMREVAGRMRDPQLASALPEPVAGQRSIELEAVADAREGEIGALEDKMAEIDGLRKQTDEALIVRDEAQSKNRRVYSNVGRLLEGIYRLAGLDELADRIRTTQRSSRKQSEPGEEAVALEPKPDPQTECSSGGQDSGEAA